MGPDAILRCFADIAESGESDAASPGAGPADIARAAHAPVWLGTSLALPLDAEAAVAPTVPRSEGIRHLATLDALEPSEHRLRLGWVVVTGRIRADDHAQGYCFPLISQPVVLERDLARTANLTLRPVGDMELTPLVIDAHRGAALEEGRQYGSGRLDHAGAEITSRQLGRLPRLQSWIRDVVAACGLPPVSDVLPASEDPLGHRSRVGLVACVGAVLYAMEPGRPAGPVPRHVALRSWAGTRGVQATAFATVYGLGTPPPATTTPETLDTPIPLSPTQRAAATRARREPLTVISGPPGSGKTHTVAAIAADAVSRGASVLLVAGSTQIADGLADVMALRPGPQPLRFGRTQPADVVAGATGPGATSAEIRSAEHALAEARSRQQMLERAITDRLEREQRALAASRWDTVLDHLDAVAPRAAQGPLDPERLAGLLRRAQGDDDDGRWRRLRSRIAEARLRTLVRADAGEPLSEVALAVRAAQDRKVATELAAAGGTTLTKAWTDLATADDEVLAAAGELALLHADSELRRRRGRSAVEHVHRLLTAGHRRRRELLHTVDAAALVATLPLWLGTVDEVDDLLPAVPGLFDLVVIDDGGYVDQLSAAGSLLRAARAVVVGDPHQLRRVTETTDEAVRAAVTDHGLDAYASRLDVRHASVLDVAAGATTATWLDEHFRSVPHLVDFSARRFYEGRLTIATRHPANDGVAAVDVVHVDAPGALDPVPHEVSAALDQVEHLAVLGESGIAVMSPFPAVAERLRTGLVNRYDLDEIDRLGLRVGPVDAFGASSADHVVLVLGLAPSDPPVRRRMVEDPDLFNVMVTRARHRLVVVTALAPPTVATPAGLIDAFLAYAQRPPRPPRRRRPVVVTPDDEPATAGQAAVRAARVSDWVSSLVEEMRSHGAAAQPSYPVGRWVLDLCVGKDGEAVAVETAVHPDGPEAHIERHRALRRVGWRIVDGYPSRWGGDAARAAYEITETLRHH